VNFVFYVSCHKGTLSEAELHILHQRMEQGRLNKARRGELFNHPPMGYVRGPAGQMQIDPDEQGNPCVKAWPDGGSTN
jgi:DNA invertase Pin-like site-specific DNA recombinase